MQPDAFLHLDHPYYVLFDLPPPLDCISFMLLPNCKKTIMRMFTFKALDIIYTLHDGMGVGGTPTTHLTPTLYEYLIHFTDMGFVTLLTYSTDVEHIRLLT